MSKNLVDNNPDWHILSSHLEGSSWCKKLPGNLSDNNHEIRWIKSQLRTSESIEQMFDLQVDTDSSSYTWDKTKLYCDQCIEEFINARILECAMARKRASESFCINNKTAHCTDKTPKRP